MYVSARHLLCASRMPSIMYTAVYSEEFRRIMADSGEGRVGRFHPKCSSGVVFSEDRRVASGKSILLTKAFAFSNDPISIGLQFSVKMLQNTICRLGIGVTTKDPDNGPVPQGWSDIEHSDQYWYLVIGGGFVCSAWHKGLGTEMQWFLDRSAGNTIGCQVLETGKLHLCHNGRDVGVAWGGLPTDQPLWGFVEIGGLKVEANYVIPKVSQPKPLPRQPFPSPPVPREGDSALYQEVTDCPDHLMLFRSYVSRNAAGKARAVLEGVGLDTSTIDACFSAHPLNDEEVVQAGLVRWRDGQGNKQPPTWEVLISAMEYARIAQQHIKELKEKLGLPVKRSRAKEDAHYRL